MVAALYILLLVAAAGSSLCAGPVPPISTGAGLASPRRVARAYEATNNDAVSGCLMKEGVPFIDSMRNDSTTFWEAAQANNQRFHFHPIAIAYPTSTAQVSKAVKCAADHGNIQVAARSGGHSFAGFSSGGQDGALIVNLQSLNQTHSDSANQLAHLGPATLLGDVVKALWADGKRGMPHGTCPTVGTGGHALCGGFGPTSRHWGMAADNLVEAEVVLADGSIVHASQHENEELWWGLRGSGSFFGIVTKFTFTTYDASSPMTFLEYRWTSSIKSIDDAAKLMESAQAFATSGSMPSELGWHIQAQDPHPGDPPGGVISIHLRGMYAGAMATYQQSVIPPLWDELAKRGLPSRPDATVEKEMTYLQMMEEWDDFGKEGDKLDTLAERVQRNNFLARTSLSMGQRGFTQRGLREIFTPLWERALSNVDKDGNDFFVWNIYFEMFGGTNARHRAADLAEKSSMTNRDALWLIQASVGTYVDHPMSHDGHAYLEKIDSTLIEALKRDNLQRGSYSCYADITLKDWKQLYYGKALPRLTELKRKLDPNNLFRNPQSLIDTPTPSSSKLVVQKDEGYANVHPLP